MSLSYRKLPALALLLAMPLFLPAQSLPKLNANFKKTALHEALRRLEADYPISFSFDDVLVENIEVSARFRNLPLDRAMSRIVKNTGLDFEIVDGKYVLIKKAESPVFEQPPPPPLLTVCGTILDGTTKETLIGATVYMASTGQGTYTDTLGRFSLSGHFTATDTLAISYMGYAATMLTAGDLLGPTYREIGLQASLTWMADVLIKDFSVDMLTLGDKNNFHFKKEKIPTLPGWGEPDVMRMLQLLPGIGSAEESAARLNIRGGTPDQNLVLWDGIPIYHTGHFFGLYDAFNPYVVSGVDVWRGNFGTEYGGRNSSVIDITGRPGYVDESTWGVGFNLLHINGFMEKPMFRKSKKKHKKGAVLVAFRRSWVDAVNSATYQKLFNQVFQNGRVAIQEKYRDESEFISWNPSINYGDFNIKFKWQNKKQNENSISLYSGFDRLDYRFAFDDSLSFFETKDLIVASNFGLSWQHLATWSPRLKVKYTFALSSYNNSYSFQWNEDDRERAFIQKYNTTNALGDFSAQFHHTLDITEKSNVSFGYQLSAQQAFLQFSDTNTVKMEANVWRQDTAVIGLHTFYASYNSNSNEKFSYTIGLRLNLFPERRIYYTEPRASFIWKPLWEGFSIKGSVGRNWQFAFQIIDFGDLGVGEPLWALAKEEIPAQELWQLTTGLQYEKKSLLVDAEIYWKGSRNLTSLNLRVDRGYDRPLSFDGTSIAKGFDLLIRKRWPPYSVWFAYSLGRVDLRFPQLNNGQPYPARHDIRHQINFVNMLSINRWDISANLHFRTGSPYTIPDVEQVPCEECTVSDFTHALNFDDLNAARLPNTVRLDVSATYSFGQKNREWKMGLSFYNLLNRRNILDKDFLLETPSRNQPQTDYQLQELDRLAAGIAPNFFVQYEW